MSRHAPSKDGSSRRQDRNAVAPLAAMILAIVAATLLGPALVSRFSDRLDRPELRSLEPLDPDTVENAVEQAPEVSSTAPTTVTTIGTPVSTSTSTTSAAPTDVAEPVRAIQLVPALRDVIVRIDGQDIASDDEGVVLVPETSVGGDVGFVGLRAQPALREVSFGSWSDGDMRAERSLADLEGPVVEIGLVVSNRVTVSTRESVPAGSEIEFESPAGSMVLTVGRTAWVPSVRAVQSVEGFEEQSLFYTTRSLLTPEAVIEIGAADFEPTPEALWVVPTVPDFSG